MIDFDNDSWSDIFIGCGHLGEDLDATADRTSYEVPPVLLRNSGRGTFLNVSNSAGDGLQVKLVARGIAFDDLDNDGRVDVVIQSLRRPPTILRNESPVRAHWLQIELRGTRANRDAVGTRVRVVAGSLAQIAEVHSGRGYQSHFGARLHFGLGDRDRIGRIDIRWPGGDVETIENISGDRRLTVIQGPSR
jgi:hypothetical protein